MPSDAVPSDAVDIFFTKVRAGWLEVRIVLGGEHYDLSISAGFSEPLKDLLRCLCDVHGLDGPTDMEKDYRHIEFEWGGEGWVYYWRILPQPGGKLSANVAFKGKREEGGVEHPVWELDFTTDWQSLGEQVFNNAGELLWMYGFAGYLARWTKDFPVGDMMRLGHLLHGQPFDADDFAREMGYLAETR